MIDASSDPLIVPVVTPQTADPSSSGRVRNLPVSAQAVPAWLERRNGTWAVKGRFADHGYVLLHDLYVAEDNMEGWAKYQRYLAAWKAGTARIAFPFDALPKEVQRRQTVDAQDEFSGEFAPPTKPTTGEAQPLPAERKGKRSEAA